MSIHGKIGAFYTDFSKQYGLDSTFHHCNICEPRYVTIKPTLRCNAACQHCNPRSKQFSTDHKLSIMEYEKLVDQLKKMNVQQICISGGEPLIYPHVVELVRLISARDIQVSINTNGWLLTTHMFERLMDAGLLTINLSLDSCFPHVHDSLRGVSGLFDKAVSQISLCRETGIPFLLNIRMILSRYNYTHIPEMIRFAHSIHANALSIDMIEADRDANHFLLNPAQIVEYKTLHIPEIIRTINELRISPELKLFNIRQINDMFNLRFNDIQNYAQGLWWPDDHIQEKCDIPCSFMIIEGDGNVLPCNAVEYNRDHIVGNLFDTNISALWSSPEWTHFRRNKMDFCRECPMNMSFTLIFDDSEITRP